MSGTRPTMKNTTLMVRYVEMAKTSHTSGRLEVRPEVALVRVRHQPVREPHAAGVDEREQARGHDREHGHGLGAAVDRGAPLRPEQVQHRGDQRPRVADADPEHEGRDVHRPHLGRCACPPRPCPIQICQAHAGDAPRRGSAPTTHIQAKYLSPGMLTVRMTSRLTSAQVGFAAAGLASAAAHALCPLSGPVSTWRTTFFR